MGNGLVSTPSLYKEERRCLVDVLVVVVVLHFNGNPGAGYGMCIMWGWGEEMPDNPESGATTKGGAVLSYITRQKL